MAQMEFAGIPPAPPKPPLPRGNDRPIKTYTDAERELKEISLSLDAVPVISERGPISYFGSKRKLYPDILNYIPKGTKEIVSSFMGGASLEIKLAAQGYRVHAYDNFEPLPQFYNLFNGRSIEIVRDVCQFYPLTYDEFMEFRDEKFWEITDEVHRAAVHWAMNKQSYLGRTFSATSVNHKEITHLSYFQEPEWRNWRNPNISFGEEDFRVSLERHEDAIAYLDPPYVTKEDVYERGKVKTFPHEELRDILAERGKFVMSYGQHELIYELYKDFKILRPQWTYNYGKAHGDASKSEELLIISHDVWGAL